MAMLAALSAVVKKDSLFCLHLNHNLRPAEECRADGELIRAFCKKNGIKCRIVSIPPGKIEAFARQRGTGVEAAARFFRQRALLRTAAQLGANTLILTAHTKDDALELALIRLLRGAGPAGLAAMPPIRGRFLRPMLKTTRAEVIEYLKAKNINWREDSTNADETFLRNRIRRRLIPILNELFPSWKTGLYSMGKTQTLAAGFIGGETSMRVKWERGNREWGLGNGDWGANFESLDCCQLSQIANNDPRSPFPSPSLFTDEKNFFAQPQIIREEALFSGIDALLSGEKNPRPVRRSVIRRFCAGELPAADLGSVKLSRENGKLLLSRTRHGAGALAPVFSESGFSLLIKEPGLYTLKGISIEVCRDTDMTGNSGFFACLPLVIRRSFNDDFLISGGEKISRRRLKENPASAADKYGTAAFIGRNGVLFARDFSREQEEDGAFCFINCKRC